MKRIWDNDSVPVGPRCNVVVSWTLLEQALGLPEGARILHVQSDATRPGKAVLYIEHPDFPTQFTGGEAFYRLPVFAESDNGIRVVRWVDDGLAHSEEEWE